MGSGIAANILNAGHELAIWNRSPGPAQALAEKGAHIARSRVTPGCSFRGLEDVRTMPEPKALWRQAPRYRQVVQTGLPEALAGIEGSSPTVLRTSDVVPPSGFRQVAYVSKRTRFLRVILGDLTHVPPLCAAIWPQTAVGDWALPKLLAAAARPVQAFLSYGLHRCQSGWPLYVHNRGPSWHIGGLYVVS
jgi:hypothetical protein